MKKAFIIGINGQDGSYLSELLLEKGYEVYGMMRRSSNQNTTRLEHIIEKLHIMYGDLTDTLNITNLISQILPDEIYNLGAQSHVKISFDIPEYSSDVNGIGQLRVLEACHSQMVKDKTYNPRIYFAGTSELFGGIYKHPVDENTPFNPRSPYAVSKLYGYWITKHYRTTYNMFCCSGILFNHESPRRGENFVTRKISIGVANIFNKKTDKITLGNIDVYRDWGHSKDYVLAMWQMLQQEEPDDYVIATNETHTVREFVERAFNLIGLTIKWKGSGQDEIGIDQNGITRITIDKKYFRDCEVDYLQGNSDKAFKKLGWKPNIRFNELVKIMVEHDLQKNR